MSTSTRRPSLTAEEQEIISSLPDPNLFMMGVKLTHMQKTVIQSANIRREEE